MSDKGDDVESTINRDGITVYQTYREERFGVPTIVLKLVSEYGEPVEVGIVVDLLPDLQIEEVGFHPEYGRENWTVDSDRLEFSDEIEPGEEVTTMYAVESLAADQLDSLLENLSIATIDVDSEKAEPVSRSESQPDSQAGTVPAEDVTAEILQSKDDPDQETDDRNGASESGAAEDSDERDAERDVDETEHEDQETGHGTESEHVDEEEAGEDAEAEDVAGEEDEEDSEDEETEDEADEVEAVPGAETVTEEGTGKEEAAVGEGSGEGGQKVTTPAQAELSDLSTGALFQELQRRISDFEASVAEIEEFDAQHGRPVVAFAELTEELETLEERVEATENDVDSLAADQEELESEVTTLQEWRDRVKSTLSALGSQ
jgi:chromosome segregation ATPase